MEVRTLGRIAKLGCSSCEEGPPSSQAILGLFRREEGALGRVIASTLMRSVLLAPGVLGACYFSGARGARLAGYTAGGALVSSLGITLFLAGYYALKGVPTAEAQAAADGVQTALPSGYNEQTIAQMEQGAANAATEIAQQVSRVTDAAMAGMRRASAPKRAQGFGGAAASGTGF